MKKHYNPYASTNLLNIWILTFILALLLQNSHGSSKDLHVDFIVESVWKSYVKHGENVVNWNYISSGVSDKTSEEIMNSQFFLDTNEFYKDVVRGHELSFLPNPILRLKKIFADDRLTIRQWNQINALFAYLYGKQREYKFQIDQYFKKRLNSLSSSDIKEDSKIFNLNQKQITKATNQFYEKIIHDIPQNIEDLYSYENFDLSSAIVKYLEEDTKMLEKFYSVEKATDQCCRLKKLSRFEKFQKNVVKYPIFHVEEKLLTTLRAYKFHLKFDVNSALARHYETIVSKIKENHKSWNKFKTIKYLHSNLFYFELEKYKNNAEENVKKGNLVQMNGILYEINDKSFDNFIFLHAFDAQLFNEYVFPNAYMEWKYKPKLSIERPALLGGDNLDYLYSIQISEKELNFTKTNILSSKNLVDLDGEHESHEKKDSLENSQFGLPMEENNKILPTYKAFAKTLVKSSISSTPTAYSSNVFNSYGSSRLLGNSVLKSSPRHVDEELNGPGLKLIEDYFSPDFKTSSQRLKTLYTVISGESSISLHKDSFINDDLMFLNNNENAQMDETKSTAKNTIQNESNCHWFDMFFKIC